MAKAPAKTTRGVTGEPAAAKEKIATQRVPHKKAAKGAPKDAPPVTEDEKEWVEAYWAVQYKYDAAPLVRMLREKPVPDWIPKSIAWLLDPPKGYLGGRLLVSKPRKRNIETVQDDYVKHRRIQDRINELTEELKSKKRALAEVGKEEDLGQSSLYAILDFDEPRRLLEFYRAAGEVDEEEYNEKLKELKARSRARKNLDNKSD